MSLPEMIKKGLECCSDKDMQWKNCEQCSYGCFGGCSNLLHEDALEYIRQLEEENEHLQEKIRNQRRTLRLCHAMYEWALGRLKKARLNDRAHFQAWLRERGYDLTTMELPEAQVGKNNDVPRKKRICPTTGLECCECKPGGPCAKEG